MDDAVALRDNLISCGVELAEVSEQERLVVDQRWLAAFALPVDKERFVSGYRDHRWHVSECVKSFET